MVASLRSEATMLSSSVVVSMYKIKGMSPLMNANDANKKLIFTNVVRTAGVHAFTLAFIRVHSRTHTCVFNNVARPCSSITLTPSFSALVNFEPAFSPASK